MQCSRLTERGAAYNEMCIRDRAYCAYALKHEFDQIDTIDILDCNGGDHGYAFATNFNPEINLREVSAPGSYWENGHWVETVSYTHLDVYKRQTLS